MKITALLAGFFGALVSVLLRRVEEWRQIFVDVISGTVTAYYAVPLIFEWWHPTGLGAEAAVTFFAGYVGVEFMRGLLAAVVEVRENPRRWFWWLRR